MSEVTISTDEAWDIVDEDDLSKELIRKSRWYTRYLVVFEHETELRGFYYDEPATEEQEGMDVFDADPVPTFPVRAEQVTVTKYSVIETN